MDLQGVKSVLVGLVSKDETASSLLRYGLALAERADAHLSVGVLSLRVVLPNALVDDVDGLVAAENARRDARAAAAAEYARREAAARGVRCMTEVFPLTYPDLAARFTTRARVHDLAVVEADSEPLSIGRGILEDALFNGGRPLIVVPKGREVFASKRVVVAWDGSAKAARAVNDALPFLRAAEAVQIISVAGEKDLSAGVPGAEVAPYLNRHGIDTVVKDVVATDGDVAAALRREAVQFGADMLVMGAFAHSRLRELVFGGVTRSMLLGPPLPTLLSH